MQSFHQVTRSIMVLSWMLSSTSAFIVRQSPAAVTRRTSFLAPALQSFSSSTTTRTGVWKHQPTRPTFALTGAKAHLSSTSRGGFSQLSATVEETSATEETTTTAYDVINKAKGLEAYTPADFESQIYQWWEASGCFQPDSKIAQDKNNKEPYVLPMPPPNVTGRLHMGHAIFVALQDVLARFHRMRGRPVLWIPGESCVYLKS